jgi:hypothetical protein
MVQDESWGRARDLWDYRDGKVTRAFDDWRLAERTPRAYLHFGLRLAEDAYRRSWAEATMETAASSAEGIDRLMEIGGRFDEKLTLSQPDYERLHLGLVLRDGVTRFEVYLEEALHEVVGPRVEGGAVYRDISPTWGDLVLAYRSLGVSIETELVKDARSIRNLLTHRGGALKTGKDAKHDKKTFGWSDLDLRLSLDEVMAHLDALAVTVDDADEVMHGYAWGDEALANEAVDTLTKAWPKLFGSGHD